MFKIIERIKYMFWKRGVTRLANIDFVYHGKLIAMVHESDDVFEKDGFDAAVRYYNKQMNEWGY